MFLKLVAENDQWAKVAAKLLTIIAIADQEDNDDSQNMAPLAFDNNFFDYFGYSEEDRAKYSEMESEIKEYFTKRSGGDWFISEKEQELLKDYLTELGLWDRKVGTIFDLALGQGEKQGFKIQGTIFTISALFGAFEEFNSTDSYISPEERRKVMIKHAILDAINSLEENLSMQQRKGILFECIALAYVDNNYSEMEQYAVKCIVDGFQMDEELVDEMIDYINQYMSLYGEIYELITE